MSAVSCEEAAIRLRNKDPTLDTLSLDEGKLTDAQFGPVMDELLAQPNAVTALYLSYNRLTDAMGTKLARLVATSSSVRTLRLNRNRLGLPTYLAVADALRTNASLASFNLHGNAAVDRQRVDSAFALALSVQPSRPAGSAWHLYNAYTGDLERLLALTAHPSLLSVLLHSLF